MSQYVIGDSDLERADVINDLGVLVDNKITLLITLSRLGRYQLECWYL
jgi:hypothetical protein